MNCERIQESFLDYQDDRLSPADAAVVREHLKTCLTCQREWAALQEISLKLDRLPPVAPSPRLREQFYAMLDTHRREEAGTRSPFVLMRSGLDRFFSALVPARPTFQFALTCAMLLLGLLVGTRYLHPTAPVPATDPAVVRELAALRENVDAMKQMMVSSSQPTGDRVKAVLATLDLQKTDQRVVSGLLNALAFDPSVNVRLSALEALYPHANLPQVRSAVAASLPRETSPLVQVTMIDFLAASRDPAALATLETVSQTPTYDQAVRDAARRALAML
jgi:anti-sigma factor RsiW